MKVGVVDQDCGPFLWSAGGEVDALGFYVAVHVGVVGVRIWYRHAAPFVGRSR
jgi:hypothetical protein